MDISVLLRDGVVYIPTSYRVDRKGFFFENAPIESVSANRTSKLREAIVTTIQRGNPSISLDQYKSLSGSKHSVLLEATGTRSWDVLDRQINGLWSVAEIDGQYVIRVKQPMQPRGWHEDKTKRVEFPSGTPVEEVIDCLIAMIQECARQEARAEHGKPR